VTSQNCNRNYIQGEKPHEDKPNNNNNNINSAADDDNNTTK